MLEYHPPCLAGFPSIPEGASQPEIVELMNFAVIRGEGQQILGLAVSDEEMRGPVVSVCPDHLSGKLWFKTEGPDVLHYIAMNSIPQDAVAALVDAMRNQAGVKIFYLHSDDSDSDSDGQEPVESSQ